MSRRDFVLQNALQYDEELRSSQDYSFWAWCLEFVRAANLRQPLVSVREHSSQVSVVRAGDQQVIANEIATDQMRRVLPGVDFQLEQVASLRQWFYEYSTRSSIEAGVPFDYLLELLNSFVAQVDAAPREKSGYVVMWSAAYWRNPIAKSDAN